ncbi:MAG TPA: glycosyltransferase family 87 protein [Vicinamibacterales bacterium]|nr:glycosyltransferase family 87 protein [Vicinamibacterales bacterium]
MPPSPRAWTRLLFALTLLFAVLNSVNALNKGGDAAVFFEGGRRLLEGKNLYAGSSAAAGFIGPPFQALFFAPFAAIAAVNATAAKLAWHLAGIVCLVAGVWLTATTWDGARSALGVAPRPWLPALFFPLLAVLLPLQTNFEHQNLNPLLLALIAGAMLQLTRGSLASGGVLVGIATALKAFPALLIGYLLLRHWRAAIIAAVTALALTAVPAVMYGHDEYGRVLADFWRLANSGWPVRGNNQSLIAAIDRYVNGFSGAGVSEQHGAVLIVYGALASALLASALWTTVRSSLPAAATLVMQISAIVVLATLLSPIAWDHYWLLLFPAFLVLSDSFDPRLLGGAGRYAFWTAAILMTGLSPLTLGKAGFNLARDLSTYTIAGVIVYVSVVTMCWKAPNAAAAISAGGRP